MAVASQRTRSIKLGTGVVSVSYHNPLWVAERIVQLDHLTRGRVMLGLGPGSLPSDGIMVGLSQSQTRPLLEDGLGVIMKLLTSDEPVTFKNDRWDLRDARLHLRPVFEPAVRHRRAGGGLAHRARSWPACTASGCCRSAPPPPPASTRWRCTGT